ncbi:hypothetical protein NO1_0145 [Candidatus Termititenax aidoneus]|uniref:Uncharacterized protein n=1 Tax=Termititenax aidoneus TaxID=2218524 RepID=A0A388TAD9_TERA1|nr:hypothetical protein NO1_0145 [Candidatus Termititenax aidoneus]
MEAVRQIVDADRLVDIVDIPESMKCRKVEIIILPDLATETKPKINKEALKKAFGSLHKYANPNLIPLEKKAWEIAVKDKYGVKNAHS